MAYKSKYSGKQVDDLLTRIEEGDLDITIDTELSPDSSNAISNSVVTHALYNKADTDDYYPAMTVGKSDNLVGRGEATQEEFSFRPSAGDLSIEDGTARITSIKGNSVVWNRQGGINGGVIEGRGVIGYFDSSITTEFIAGHKYLVVSNLIEAEANNTSLDIYTKVNGTNTILQKLYLTKYSYLIFESQYNAKSSLKPADGTCWLYSLIESPVTKLDIHDLTKMFGVKVANTITSIEQFNELKPMNIADEFAYNTGNLVDMRVNEIKSVGNNAYDYRKGYARVVGGKEYFLDGEIQNNPQFSTTIDGEREDLEFYAQESMSFPNDGYLWVEGSNICVCLRHSYDKPITPYEEDSADLSWIYSIKDNDGNLLFPNGLRSAGTAFDEIRYNRTTKKWEAVKRIGEVDLGSLEWSFYSNYNSFATTQFYPLPKVCFKGVCNKYPFLGKIYDKDTDKVCGYIFNTCINVRDSSYTDAASFKQAMQEQGVKLYYELAEPIEVELDENINLDYLVWDFGTEEAIASVPSSPFKADIIYQFNAVDRIRENTTRVRALEDIIQALQLQITTLTQQIKEE